MFWHWFEPWGFMNTEPGKHESQFEALSQRLFGRTFWGSYGGDILTRYYYTALLEDYPLAVASIEAGHGQALVLSAVEPDNEEYRDQLREVIRFLAHFDPNSSEYVDYIWGEDAFSQFEYDLAYEEMTSGWWGTYYRNELVEYFVDWEDNTIVPEGEEWGELLQRVVYDDGEFYPYWETADSLIVPGWDTEKVAERLLEEYARSITEAGNPEPLHTEI